MIIFLLIIMSNRIINGQAETGFLGVVLIYLTKSGTFGTGVLISPKIVLTAAHVLPEKSEKIEVYFGNGFYDYDQKVVAKNFKRHESYNPNSLNNDIGLVELNKSVEYDYYTYNNDKNKQMKDVFSVGFGQTENDQSGVKYSANLVVSNTTNKWINCKTTDNETNSSLFFGDSGGPQFFIVNGKYVIYGIHSHIFMNRNSVNVSVSIKVDKYINWISKSIVNGGLNGKPLTNPWMAPMVGLALVGGLFLIVRD